MICEQFRKHAVTKGRFDCNFLLKTLKKGIDPLFSLLNIDSYYSFMQKFERLRPTKLNYPLPEMTNAFTVTGQTRCKKNDE